MGSQEWRINAAQAPEAPRAGAPLGAQRSPFQAAAAGLQSSTDSSRTDSSSGAAATLAGLHPAQHSQASSGSSLCVSLEHTPRRSPDRAAPRVRHAARSQHGLGHLACILRSSCMRLARSHALGRTASAAADTCCAAGRAAFALPRGQAPAGVRLQQCLLPAGRPLRRPQVRCSLCRTCLCVALPRPPAVSHNLARGSRLSTQTSCCSPPWRRPAQGGRPAPPGRTPSVTETAPVEGRQLRSRSQSCSLPGPSPALQPARSPSFEERAARQHSGKPARKLAATAPARAAWLQVRSADGTCLQAQHTPGP